MCVNDGRFDLFGIVETYMVGGANQPMLLQSRKHMWLR